MDAMFVRLWRACDTPPRGGGVERKTRSHLLLISNSAHIQYPSLLSQTSAVFCNMGGGEMRDPESFPLYLSFPAPTSDPVIVTKYISTRTGPSQPPTWKDFACHCRTIVPPTTSLPLTPHVAGFLAHCKGIFGQPANFKSTLFSTFSKASKSRSVWLQMPSKGWWVCRKGGGALSGISG